MSKFSESLINKKFTVTSEIGPPKGVNTKGCIKDAELLRERVDAVNVTDNQSAVMRIGSAPVCRQLLDIGIEPIFQMVCRDRNKIALQSDLLGAWSMGIENVLCLTGDHNTLGDHPGSMPVFELDSVQLIKAVTDLNSGKDMENNELEGTPDFFPGAVVAPEADPLEPQIIKMKKKIDAGARFFQTQAVYNPNMFEKFMNIVQRFNVPVLVGIVILKSAAMARFMNKNVAGINVPEEIIKRMAELSKEERPKMAVEISAEIIEKVKPMCQGVHIMPLGWDRHVPAILDAVNI